VLGNYSLPNFMNTNFISKVEPILHPMLLSCRTYEYQ
jgi:hypothetical protein